MGDFFVRLWKKHKVEIFIISGIIAVYAVLSVLGVATCPSKVFFGIPCPGCGISRAFMSALQLDFAAAFEYNPLWILVPVVLIIVTALSAYDKNRAVEIIVIAFIVLAFLVYIYRIVHTNSAVVEWDLESGLFYSKIVQIIDFLKNYFQ